MISKITNHKHDKRLVIFAASRMLERGAFYGLRALLLLYMIGETHNLPDTEAIAIYGYFGVLIIGMQVLGGILGDLLIGDKRAIHLGGLLQAVGAFVLCAPSLTALYVAIGLIALGGGLYSPNLSARLGRSYLNKSQLLDGAFTAFYTVINIGSIIGILTIGYLGEANFKLGFVLAGFLFVLATLITFLDNNPLNQKFDIANFNMNRRTLIVAIVIIFLGVFWAIYEMTFIDIMPIQLSFSENSSLGLSDSLWVTINSFFLLPIGVIASIIWSYYYMDQIRKVIVGFLLGGIAFALLLFLPNEVNDDHLAIYFSFIILLSTAEILIAPTINSVLTKYLNPKYLAILMAIGYLPIKFFTSAVAIFNDQLYDNPGLSLRLGVSLMLVMGAIMAVIYMLSGRHIKEPQG